jgi:ATP-dependent RNA helicase DeaD
MTSFSTIGIREDILKAVEALGFTAPTPVQFQTIPLLLSGHNDLVGLAQTGTGKTAAFGLPIIQLIDPKRKIPQALVLCPTRELCMQVTKDLETYSRFTPGIKAVAVYGGANIVNQIRDLKRGAQIVVATPGRLLDLLRRGEANIASIQTLVLDEADEMLQMGFQDELNAILAQTPATKRTVLFSATMPREVAAIAQKYMRDPIEITVGDRNTGTENVEHVYYVVQNHNRYAAMKRIADINPDMYAIVFCRTRQETKDIAEKFIKDGYNAEALHGELSQSQRDQVMDRFRAMNLRLLVATDVAARGIDVKDLTHVVNYNLPDESANYTHRSGRTGRAGRTGISVSLVTANERYKILEIEKRIKRKFERGIIPTAHDICERQLFNHIETIKKVAIAKEQIQRYMPAINESLAELSREELITRLLSLEFNRLLEYYQGAPDLNIKEVERPKRAFEGKDVAKPWQQSSQSRVTRFHLSVGKREGMTPKLLLAGFNDALDNPNIKIGRIEIMRNSTTIEADSRYADSILKAFHLHPLNGRFVTVTIDHAPGGRPVAKPREFDNRKSAKFTPKNQDRKPRQWTQSTARPIF